MTHGTRNAYKQGCRCVSCRSAHAAYHREYRRLKALGKPPLGALVPADETWRQVKHLQSEYGTRALLAWSLGQVNERLRGRLRLGTVRVRLRTALKVRRLYRAALSEDVPISREPRRGGTSGYAR